MYESLKKETIGIFAAFEMKHRIFIDKKFHNSRNEVLEEFRKKQTLLKVTLN